MTKRSFLVLTLVLVGLLVACRPASRTQAPAPSPQGVPAEGFFLSLVEPQDEAVVSGELLRVAGRTNPEAILSVNGRMVRYVDVDGNFSTVVTLLEGPNLLEVLASDYDGRRASQSLTVIYAPQN